MATKWSEISFKQAKEPNGGAETPTDHHHRAGWLLHNFTVQVEARVGAGGGSRVDEDFGVALPKLKLVSVSRDEDVNVQTALSDRQSLLISPGNDL
jgi:hypothetical protein